MNEADKKTHDLTKVFLKDFEKRLTKENIVCEIYGTTGYGMSLVHQFIMNDINKKYSRSKGETKK